LAKSERRYSANIIGLSAPGGKSASKAIEFGEINRKPVCNFLLVINTNWHPFSYPFRSYRRLLFRFWTKNSHFAFWGGRGSVHCASVSSDFMALYKCCYYYYYYYLRFIRKFV